MFKNCPKPDGWYGCFAEDEWGDSIKLTGKTTLPIGEGLVINVEDKDTEDDSQGGIKVLSYEILTDTPSRMTNYLTLVPCLTRFQAREMVREFGTDVLKVLAEEPDKIRDKIGLSEDDIIELEGFTKNITALMSIKRIAPSLTEAQIRKIINYFDNPTQTILKAPYDLLEAGIPWRTVDTIALTTSGIAPNSRYRINHAITYAIKIFVEQTGNLCVNMQNTADRNALAGEINKLLMSNYATDALMTEIEKLSNIEEVPLVIENINNSDYLYEEVYHKAETNVAKELNDNFDCHTPKFEKEVRRYIDEFMIKENQNL
jgi:hypothetical protein